MNLKSYLMMNQISIADFAEGLEVSRSCIAHYLSGLRVPSLEIARKIEKKTKGKVTIDELLEYAKRKRIHNGLTTDTANMVM